MKNITTVTIDASWAKDFEQAVMRAAEKAIDATLSEVRSAQVMPYDTGDMQNVDTYTDTRKTRDGVLMRIITDSPQARRLYFHPKYNFQTVNNPNAGAEWFKPWTDKGQNKDFTRGVFEKYLNEELKK